MNIRAIFIAAISSGALGCILLIIAISSTAWTTGCMDYGALMKTIGQMMGGSDGVVPSIQPHTVPDLGGSLGRDENVFGGFDSSEFSNTGDFFPASGKNGPYSDTGIGNSFPSADFFRGIKICLSQGLFKMNMNVAGLADTSVKINFSTLSPAVVVGIVGIAISLLLGAVGVVVMTTSATGSVESYQSKGKVANRTGIGMIILILSCIAGVVGMASYTGGSQQELHNPAIVFERLGSSMSQAVSQMTAGRGKRDITDFTSSLGRLDNTGGANDISKSIWSLLNFHMHYSYAFAFGWVGVILVAVGAILSAVAKQVLINQPYQGNTNVNL